MANGRGVTGEWRLWSAPYKCARHPACPEWFCEGSGAKDLSSACGATSDRAKTPIFALRLAAKTVRPKFLAIRHFAVAFPSPLA